MVVLDHLALLIAVVLGNHPTTAECDPLSKSIERLALVGRRLDRSAQFDVAQVREQKLRSDHAAELSEGEIEFVLAAGAS